MKSAPYPAKLLSVAALCLLAFAPLARADNPTPPTMTDNPNPKPAIVVALETATDGLLMPSETDAIFKIVYFAREMSQPVANAPRPVADGAVKTEGVATPPAISIQELAKLAGAPTDAKIETRDLDEFFAVAMTTEEWMNDEERATAAKFAALLQILKTQLKGAQVLVWGEAEKQVAILGEAEGGLAGVLTIIVET